MVPLESQKLPGVPYIEIPDTTHNATVMFSAFSSQDRNASLKALLTVLLSK
ncbi:MAG: hypothetical protein WCS77_01495 [Elusimicrobiaceae bacterium]